VIVEDRVRVDVKLVLLLDAKDIPEDHQDEVSLRSIIEEVINAGIYDVPGATIHKIKMSIEGID
jgi:hypothetical protein